MREISAMLPFPPSANRYWRVDKRHGGHVHRSAVAEVYCEVVARLAQLVTDEPIRGDVEIRAIIYRPAKRGDLSNTIKILEDSLRGHFYVDDKQTARIHWIRQEDPANPRVELWVTEVEVTPPPLRIHAGPVYLREFALARQRLAEVQAETAKRERRRRERRLTRELDSAPEMGGGWKHGLKSATYRRT